MNVQVRDVGAVTVVRPEDRLDIVGYLELEECLAGLLRRGRNRLVLDMVEATFINSASMGVIGRFWADCARAGGVLVVARPSREARNFLRLSEVDHLVDIFGDLEEAIATAARRGQPAPSAPDGG